ncbi:MAG: right-handed parallel beta-helix repeat-containing protein [Paracoccaceae bacterium]
MRHGRAMALVALLAGAIAGDAKAADFLVRPVTPAAGGSVDAPEGARTWPSVEAVLKSGGLKGGDRILLMAGDHGPLVVRGARFAVPVVIEPQPGAAAHVGSITTNDAAFVTFRGLQVWPKGGAMPGFAVVLSGKKTADLVFEGLDIRSADDAAGFAGWALEDWRANKVSGMLLQGARTTVRDVTVTGAYNGILLTGDGGVIEGSLVDGFSGDGMRALGNDSRISHNTIRNCIIINDSHRDGIQSYSTGPDDKPGAGTQRRLVIEGNRILEWTLPVASPLRCAMQGIGMFDGMFDGVRIENNVIVVSAYHGIAMAGALNSVIRNNTVVAANGRGGKRPWIRVGAHKNGTPSGNVLVTGNLTNFLNTKADAGKGIVVSGNVTAVPLRDFVDFGRLDLRLRPSSPAVDAADRVASAATDIDGVARWKGQGPDAGAHESY